MNDRQKQVQDRINQAKVRAKINKVINSCVTVPQFQGAFNYISLACRAGYISRLMELEYLSRLSRL